MFNLSLSLTFTSSKTVRLRSFKCLCVGVINVNATFGPIFAIVVLDLALPLFLVWWKIPVSQFLSMTKLTYKVRITLNVNTHTHTHTHTNTHKRWFLFFLFGKKTKMHLFDAVLTHPFCRVANYSSSPNCCVQLYNNILSSSHFQGYVSQVSYLKAVVTSVLYSVLSTNSCGSPSKAFSS